MDMLRIEDLLRELLENSDVTKPSTERLLCTIRFMFDELPLDKQQLLTVRHYEAMCIFKEWLHGTEEQTNRAIKKAT